MFICGNCNAVIFFKFVISVLMHIQMLLDCCLCPNKSVDSWPLLAILSGSPQKSLNDVGVLGYP